MDNGCYIDTLEVYLLPFLKKAKDAQISGVIVKHRSPDENTSEESQDDPAAAIESCAQELIRAVHAKDTKAVAEALKDAFDILEELPHDEVDHSYDEQNKLAGENE